MSKAPERRELAFAELVDALRRRQILEPVFAEVSERFSVCECGRRAGYEDLAAVPRGCDARRAMDVYADVSLLAEQRRSRVQAHADANRSGGERLLRLRCGCQGPRRRRERDEERVTLRIHFGPVVPAAGLADDASMPSERLRVLVCADLVEEGR